LGKDAAEKFANEIGFAPGGWAASAIAGRFSDIVSGRW